MNIIEVKDNLLNWIAAVYANKADTEEYLKQIKGVHGENVIVKTIPVDRFPVYAIEYIKKDEGGKDQNYFEYTNEEGYLKLIKNQKATKDDDNWKAYFTAYIFDEDYFQQTYESSLMGALNHVHINNYFLDSENAEKGLQHDKIARFASDWNLAGLDSLFEKYIKNGSQEEKEELAIDGYISLFCAMDYDFACGKLTGHGIDLLLPMAEKSSLLMGKKLWNVYSRAYMILLENSFKNHFDKVDKYFSKAKKAIHENITASPEDHQDAYYQLALIHNQMAEHHHFNSNYWQKAIEYIQQSIGINPEQGNWLFYLNLLYVPYHLRKTGKIRGVPDDKLPDLYNQWNLLRKKELENFKTWIYSLKDEIPSVALKIALAFDRLKEQLEWHKADTVIFPEKDYQFWLNEAQKIEGHRTTRIELIEEAHFFQREGKRLERTDLIETAIRHFDRLIEKVEDPVFEIYYKASALEDIADIHLKNKEIALAEAYLDEATEFYDTHLELVKSNPSVFMHYTEFLERCFLFEGNIKKPTIEKIKQYATIAEEEGQGMYSAPTILLVRLELLEHHEEEAILHLSRLLLLHELCVENVIKNLQLQIQFAPFNKLNLFLEDTLKFMEQVSEGYYLDPCVRWKELKQMDAKEIINAWGNQKEIIKNRRKNSG